ncbi:MAG: DNA translocase FtsK 4TM domain-containing protein [Deltaproteobacteria bacterium]|nr:DNA translocase FtsK 4TM domain-containing protein [Deltaproteobacteria bacterium]
MTKLTSKHSSQDLPEAKTPDAALGLMTCLRREIAALVWLAVGAFLLMALYSYDLRDPTFGKIAQSSQIYNAMGSIGSHIAGLLYQAFGFAAFLLPLAAVVIALRLLVLRKFTFRLHKILAVGVLVFSLCGLLSLRCPHLAIGHLKLKDAGGSFGHLLATLPEQYLNVNGTTLVLGLTALIALLVATRFSLLWWVHTLIERSVSWWRAGAPRRAARQAEKEEQRQLRHEQREAERLQREEQRREEQRQREQEKLRRKQLQEEERRRAAAEAQPGEAQGWGETVLDEGLEEIAPPQISQMPSAHAAGISCPPEVSPQRKARGKKARSDGQEANQSGDVSSEGAYEPPALNLLDLAKIATAPQEREVLMKNAHLLENKLSDFHVDGQVVEVKPGPVVTMYEYLPAPGIKVNKIASLQDDLTMALRAHSIRIVAPIPGSGVVGIEIPNPTREMVLLRDILENDAFQQAGSKLPMALGKDIFGQAVVADLAKMPHLLVAGATGSGKSVSVNTMILSLVYHASPKDVRFIMVDPKRLELSIYEGIPHLLLPVVTDPKKAGMALAWALREMDRRYQLMSDKQVRNIDGYNQKIAQELEQRPAPPVEESGEDAMTEKAEPELEHGHLPYIVIIVDELADLMMVAGREIEESITRLAQMARAAGIHLILATQRPSVDVITGLIKANFPTRISFKVVSRTDSRTILDVMGAEALLGSGDMLFRPPGSSVLKRVHGAYVSDGEVERVVEYLKTQGSPEYDESILETPGEGGYPDGQGDDGYDEKWDEALALVARTRQASISMLQRHLRIGYNRSARIIEQMEREGIIGPSDGTSRPREIFIDPIE